MPFASENAVLAPIVPATALAGLVVVLMVIGVAILALRAGSRHRSVDATRARLVLNVDAAVVTIDLDAVGADDPQEVERAVRAARRRTRGLAA